MRYLVLIYLIISTWPAWSQDLTKSDFVRYKKSKILINEKNYEEALLELEKIESVNNAYLQRMRVECYVQLENYPKAKNCISEYYLLPGQSISLSDEMSALSNKIEEIYFRDSVMYESSRTSSEELTKYLESAKFPFFADNAINLIDDLDFNSVKAIPTELGYLNYLKKHPRGRHVSEARSKLSRYIIDANTENEKMALLYEKKSRKSALTAGLVSPVIPLAAVGAYFGMKLFLKNEESIPGIALLAGGTVLMLAGGVLPMIIKISDSRNEKKTAMSYRNQIKSNPYAGKVTWYPYTAGSSSTGVLISLTF